MLFKWLGRRRVEEEEEVEDEEEEEEEDCWCVDRNLRREAIMRGCPSETILETE